MDFEPSPRRLLRLQFTIAALLAVAGVAVQVLRYGFGHDFILGAYPLFNLAAEATIPAWYTSISLLLCAVLLAVIAGVKRVEGDRFARHWRLLAAIFLVLSIDEAARLHETIGGMIESRVVGINWSRGFLFYGWVVPAFFALGVFGLAFLRFLLHLPARERRWFLISAALYLGGAVGMEMINGKFHELHGRQNIPYHLLTALEETLELVGATVFAYTLMTYLMNLRATLTVRIVPEAGRRAKAGKKAPAGSEGA